MQLIVIISGCLYNEHFVVLTAVVEFVWLCVCYRPKNCEHNSARHVRNGVW